MFLAQRRSALLVDFENLYKSCGEEKFVRSIDNWLSWLEQGAFDSSGIRRTFLSKEVFWNTHHDIFRLEFQRRRFKPTVCRAIRKEKASSADFDITIRAAELRHEFRNIQEVVILSLDSDFSSVLYHLQLHEIIGVGMTDPATQFSPNYKNIVDIAIEKGEFERAYAYRPERRGWFERSDAVVVPMLAREGSPKPTSAPESRPNAASAASKAGTATSAKRAPPAHGAGQTRSAAPTPSIRLDFAAAAAVLAKHAEANGLNFIGRERVKKLLQNLPGFVSNGRPWGGGSYQSVLQALVGRNSKFSIEKLDRGGVILAYKMPARDGAARS